ncbi:hypothetical protein [Phenylobacterium sp.]|uniref:hypothetical protein n=1 Tax=Phenylobacterium sp. TaxID=1871053 RepID=UPI0035AEADA2
MPTRRMIVLGAAASATSAIAAPTPWRENIKPALDAVVREGRYLPLYTLAKEGDRNTSRDLIGQWAAIAGDEPLALAGRPLPTDTPPDMIGATSQNAIAAIVAAARGRRVVILNEMHNASRHRLFLGVVLRALRPHGFTHLAAETFSNEPDEPPVGALTSRAQLRPAHGFYLWDPVLAEAVREAMALEYQLVSYEARRDQQGVSINPQLRVPLREQAQADNLAMALERWPKARFVVHAGAGHISETNGGTLGPMFAERLRARTGIDPLTIGQGWAGSFGPHAIDDNTCAAVLARFRPKTPIAVWTAAGAPLERASHGIDMAIYHPRLEDRGGRPGWLAADPARRRKVIALNEPAAGPALAQAIHAADTAPAIPADQHPVVEGARRLVFHLHPGRYRLRLETATGFRSLGEIRV